MTEPNEEGLTRRAAIVAGIAGAAALAACAPTAKSSSDEHPVATSGRMPVVYAPHGGGPWPFVEMGLPKSELDALTGYLQSLRSVPKVAPKALLVVSAHWEESVPTVMTSPQPPLLFDYYGFPKESYELTWPAPGDPKLAGRVRELLGAAGFESASDAARGFDHGTFVPFKVTYPEAHIPTVQLSLKKGLDPAEHLAIGRAIAPLRDEGVFILGSGMSFHNMRAFRSGQGAQWADTFDEWLSQTATLDPAERDRRLVQWASAPAARQAHPREEHLMPLMVIAGAAGSDRGTTAFNAKSFGVRISGYHFG